VIQSLPFVLVGVFASALVQQVLKGEFVARWMPRQALPAVLVSSLFGLVAPVCDCGAIPLGRQLIAKGVPVYAGVTFLLAAPVVNPIVLFSTALAFQGSMGVVVLRLSMTLSVALIVGLIASRLVAPRQLEVPTLAARLRDGDKNDENPRGGWQMLALVTTHATGEYFDVVFFIVLGALFTAASQTFIPRGDLISLGSHQAGSVLALMPVATVLSICSEADAFVARAFASNFSVGAVLAFMTIGQLVDLRNGLLLWRTLGTQLALLTVLTAYPLIFVEGVLINGLLVGT
jgi:uncharacterized membrane protein YraQ (UPF0718 family)